MPQSNKTSNSKLQIELENRILHGISAEWELFSWMLDKPLRQHFKKPIFSLSDMTNRWGYWSYEDREICLSRNLVRNYSWATVREILKHEMAHQLTQEVLGGLHEKPHGETFQKACHLLRANPKASDTYPTLDDRIHAQEAGDDDRLLTKVQKLMALAESSNQHEAEAAMAKAYELMTRFNISLMEQTTIRNYETIFVGKPALRNSREMHRLAVLLHKYYFVECIWVQAYVVEKQKMGRVLELIGTVQNLQIAEYVYYFVKNFIDTQWKQYNKTKRLSYHRRNDFAEGILEGFEYTLKKQKRRLKRKHSLDDQALMKISDPQLIEYTNYLYPRIKNTSCSIGNSDETIINDGRRVGKNLVISKGITGNSVPDTLVFITS